MMEMIVNDLNINFKKVKKKKKILKIREMDRQ